MDKKRLKLSGMIDQIKTEIKIMYSLNHENIVKLFNHFEDDNSIYLVIDYAPGVKIFEAKIVSDIYIGAIVGQASKISWKKI